MPWMLDYLTSQTLKRLGSSSWDFNLRVMLPEVCAPPCVRCMFRHRALIRPS